MIIIAHTKNKRADGRSVVNWPSRTERTRTYSKEEDELFLSIDIVG